MSCELCLAAGGALLWRGSDHRVVMVDEAAYPGFCRVIWNVHVPEMTDLPAASRDRLMSSVYAVEKVMRELLQPDKINLASLGNVVPHVHWHVIPRFVDDPHFPAPIWAAAQRKPVARRLDTGRFALAVAERLQALHGESLPL